MKNGSWSSKQPFLQSPLAVRKMPWEKASEGGRRFVAPRAKPLSATLPKAPKRPNNEAIQLSCVTGSVKCRTEPHSPGLKMLCMFDCAAQLRNLELFLGSAAERRASKPIAATGRHESFMPVD